MARLRGIRPPSGYYESTLDWIQQSGNQHLLTMIYPEIPHPPVEREEEKRLLVGKQKTSNKAFVAILPNGRVVGERAVISPDNKLLWDVSVEWAKHAPEHSIFKEKRLPPLIRTEKTVALLTHPAGYNYYHWLLEAIARIHLLEKNRIQIDKYIVNHRSYPFQLKTLAYCGIPANKIARPHDRFHLQASRLVVPSYVNLPNEWSVDYVRSKVLPHMASQLEAGYDKLYIIRKNRRRVVNENEILRVLEPLGFRAIELESMPFEKQIRLFHSAKTIVGAHGAGLANLVFCKPRTKVVELFTPRFMEPHYWLMSRLLRLDYRMIVGKRRNPHPNWSGFEDLWVDPRKLLEVL